MFVGLLLQSKGTAGRGPEGLGSPAEVRHMKKYYPLLIKEKFYVSSLGLYINLLTIVLTPYIPRKLYAMYLWYAATLDHAETKTLQ